VISILYTKRNRSVSLISVSKIRDSAYLQRVWLREVHGDAADNWNEDVEQLSGGVAERQVADT